MTVMTELGKITGSVMVLNALSLALDSASEQEKRKQHFGMSAQYREASKQLYEALDKVGAYK